VHDDILDDTIRADARLNTFRAPTEPDVADTILVGTVPPSAPRSAAGHLVEVPAPDDLAVASGVVLHYHLRIGATVVALDKVAYIGRNPTAPRVMVEGVQHPSRGAAAWCQCGYH
jgi:hypothetical protein